MSSDILLWCVVTSLTLWATCQGDETVPALCYNVCNNAFIIAQSYGLVPALCSSGDFLDSVAACEACVAAHSAVGTNQFDPDFEQYINYCSATTTISTTSTALAFLLSEISSLQSEASSLNTSYSNLPSASASATPGLSITTIYATLTPSNTPSSVASGKVNPSTTDGSNVSSTTSSTSQTWIAGAVIGPVVGIGAIVLIIILTRRRIKSRFIKESTEEKPHFDKAQLHADSLPRKDPSELVGSPVTPVELPAREDVAVEMGDQREKELGQ